MAVDANSAVEQIVKIWENIGGGIKKSGSIPIGIDLVIPTADGCGRIGDDLILSSHYFVINPGSDYPKNFDEDFQLITLSGKIRQMSSLKEAPSTED